MNTESMPEKTGGKVAELIATLPAAPRVLILPHNNPDPDALASATALCTLLTHHTQTSPLIGLGGIIGRSENRAMVSVLDIPLVPVEQLFPNFTEPIILVDTQPRRANNSLPAHLTPAAVIDHHPDWGTNSGVPFVDLRENYGATSTILTEYLQEAEQLIDRRVATALFYGISSETQHLGRETKPADIVASQFLYPYVHKRLLGEIEHPLLTRDYFRLMGQALYNAVLYEDVVVTILDSAPYPDAVAELADFLLRMESVQWSACLAPYKDFLYVSLRSSDPNATAGLLLASLLPSGMAGGHGMIAGGKMKLPRRKWREAAAQLAQDFLRALNKVGVRAQPLVDSSRGKRAREKIRSLLLSLPPPAVGAAKRSSEPQGGWSMNDGDRMGRKKNSPL